MTIKIIQELILPIIMFLLTLNPQYCHGFVTKNFILSRRLALSEICGVFGSSFPRLFLQQDKITNDNDNIVKNTPFQDGTVSISRQENNFKLYYRIYNSSMNEDTIPLVVLHGGPSLPSQYLYPLVALIPDRPIIFFDQLGCGKSSEPKDINFYSIAQSVTDIVSVITQLIPGSSFHLLGHSFGGVLAYEYMKKLIETGDTSALSFCKSVIISNAPSNMQLANNEYDRLYQLDPDRFWEKYMCSKGTPYFYNDALQNVGSVWGGMDAVVDYVATPITFPTTPSTSNIPSFSPATLVLTSTNDFTYEASRGWKDLLPATGNEENSLVVNNIFYNFGDCTHCPFYDDPNGFAKVVNFFLVQNDEDVIES